jgi:hypothetical protein
LVFNQQRFNLLNQCCFRNVRSFKQTNYNMTWHPILIDKFYYKCKCVKPYSKHPRVKRSSGSYTLCNGQEYISLHCLNQHVGDVLSDKQFVRWKPHFITLSHHETLQPRVFNKGHWQIPFCWALPP